MSGGSCDGWARVIRVHIWRESKLVFNIIIVRIRSHFRSMFRRSKSVNQPTRRSFRRDQPNPESGQPPVPVEFPLWTKGRFHRCLKYPVCSPVGGIDIGQSIMADDTTSKPKPEKRKRIGSLGPTFEDKESNLSGHVSPQEPPHKYEVHPSHENVQLTLD